MRLTATVMPTSSAVAAAWSGLGGFALPFHQEFGDVAPHEMQHWMSDLRSRMQEHFRRTVEGQQRESTGLLGWINVPFALTLKPRHQG